MSEGRRTGLEAAIDAAWVTFRRRLADRLEQVEEDELLLLEVESGTSEDELDGCAPYAQFCGWGDGMIRAEVVSDHYLDARYELGAAGDASLRALGWDPPAEDEEAFAELNYSVDLHQDDVEQLAVMVVRALREVYGCPHPAFVVSDDFDGVEGRPVVDEDAAVAASRAAELAAVQPESVPELQALVDAALEVVFEGAAEHDDDGDIAITCGRSQVFVRVAQELPAIELFAQLVLGVEETPAALALVNEVNARSVDRQLSVVDGLVLARTRVLATPFVPAQLRAAVHLFCDGLDELAERLAEATGGRRFLDPKPVPPRPRPPVQVEADGLTELLEVLHEGSRVDPATVAVLLGGDRRAIVAYIVAIRNGVRDLDGLDEGLVLGHLRRALRHLALRRVHQDRATTSRRRESRQLTLLPDEGSLDGGSWDADLA